VPQPSEDEQVFEQPEIVLNEYEDAALDTSNVALDPPAAMNLGQNLPPWREKDIDASGLLGTVDSYPAEVMQVNAGNVIMARRSGVVSGTLYQASPAHGMPQRALEEATPVPPWNSETVSVGDTALVFAGRDGKHYYTGVSVNTDTMITTIGADSGADGSDITSLIIAGAGSVTTAVAESPAGTATVTVTGTDTKITNVGASAGIAGTDISTLNILQGAGITTTVSESPEGTATVTITNSDPGSGSVDEKIGTVGASAGTPGTAISTLNVVQGGGITTTVSESPGGTATITITNSDPGSGAVDEKIGTVGASAGTPGTEISTLNIVEGTGITTTVAETPAGTATVTIACTVADTDTQITNVGSDAGAGTNISTLNIVGAGGITTGASESPAGTATVTIDGSGVTGTPGAGFVSSTTLRQYYKETDEVGDKSGYATVTTTVIDSNLKGAFFLYCLKAAEAVTDMNVSPARGSRRHWPALASDFLIPLTSTVFAHRADLAHKVSVRLYIDATDGYKLKLEFSDAADAAAAGTIEAYAEVQIWLLAENSSETDTSDGVDYDYVGDGH